MENKFLDQPVFGLEAGDALHGLAAFKEHQGGNAHHLVIHGYQWLVVHIQPDDFDFSLPFIRQLLHDRVEHFAWCTPGRAEIHQHRQVGLEHFGLEIPVR